LRIRAKRGKEEKRKQMMRMKGEKKETKKK
jgi:hypothetical protein